MREKFTRFLVLTLLTLSAVSLRASTCTAIVNNGAWSSSSTWSCGHVPGNNDTMWIPLGFTVDVDINSPTYSNMLVIVDGILNFGNGQKLNICPGGVYVSSTGVLMGGTPGSKINICGSTVWNGPGPTYGEVSYGSVTLPVELVSFIANPFDKSVLVEWKTATETNNHYFTVERSTNGFTFEAIGQVNGNGTSTQPHSYSFTDQQPAQGTNYYRLRQTDFNGQSETFHIVAVNFSDEAAGCVLSVYPNPCESQCTVSLSDCPSDNEGTISVEMMDATGRTVSSFVPERNSAGGFSYTIDTANNLKPGVYIIRGTSSKKVYQQKAVLK